MSDEREPGEDTLLPGLAQVPTTGDPHVDESLRRFASRSAHGDLDDQVTAGQRIEQDLRERLTGLEPS